MERGIIQKMFNRSKDVETNEEKITRLYEKYNKLMRSEAFHILKDFSLAEDAVQQAFLKILSNIEKINCDSEIKIKNYLVIVCRNIAINCYNERLYLNENSETIDFESENNDSIIDYMEPSKLLIDRENVKRISYLIDRLPPIYRDVLLLEKFYHNTKEEIAILLGTNYETVKKRSLRARKMLVEAMEREGLRNG